MLMAYDIILRQTITPDNGTNTTIIHERIFQASHESLKSPFSLKWIALPDFLQSASMMLLYIGAVEFLSSQVPYSMKGLMVGMTYCSFLLSFATWLIVTIPFRSQTTLWDHGTISCGFWNILLLAIVQIGICFVLTMLVVCYKKRKREDVLPYDHIYAEYVYEKYLNK